METELSREVEAPLPFPVVYSDVFPALRFPLFRATCFGNVEINPIADLPLLSTPRTHFPETLVSPRQNARQRNANPRNRRNRHETATKPPKKTTKPTIFLT